MPSAFVSERIAQTGLLPGALLRAAFVAAVAACGTAAMISHFDEPFSDRTRLLVLIAACGGLAAMLPVALMAGWIASTWNPWLRGILSGVLVGAAFVPATMFWFAVQIRIVEGRIEADSVTEMRPGDLFWSMFGAMGMFTPTGLRYLTPWTLGAVALTAAILLFFWPRPALPH